MTAIGRHPLFNLLGSIGNLMVAIAFLSPAVANAAKAQEQIHALGFAGTGKVLWKAGDSALHKSSDAGRTWEAVTLPKLPKKSAITEISFPYNRSGGLYIAGPGMGVWASNDAGRTWTDRSKGLPAKNVVALSGHATQADTVYAYVKDKGIFKSDDGGATWQKMDKGPRQAINSFVHSNMEGSMQTGWLFAATSKGVKRSMDCFCGWHDAGSLNGKFIATAYDAKEPKRVYAATSDSVYRSEDGGEEWEKISAPAKQITGLVATPAGELFAAASGKLFKSTDKGKTWESIDA